MANFWEPPPLLVTAALVGIVILAYAIGLTTSPSATPPPVPAPEPPGSAVPDAPPANGTDA